MFINERLLDRVSYGFVGGPTFNPQMVDLSSGIVRRNVRQSRPVWKFSAPYNKIEVADRQALIDAFIGCLGPVHSFRFRDYADYMLQQEVIGALENDGINELQLIKTYTFGPSSIVRDITKPIADTLAVELDGVPTPAVVDELTGIVTVSGLTNQICTATCLYDVPVFFRDADLQTTVENWEAHTADIGLIEDRSQ